MAHRTLLLTLCFALAAPVAHAEAGDSHYAVTLNRLRRVVACDLRGAEQVEPPAGITRGQLDWHCKRVRTYAATYEKRWLSKARPFFEALVPATLPNEVVYPFGGADLLTPLAVFGSKMKTLTTISLEPAGDPRQFETLSGGTLRASLRRHRDFLGKLFFVNHNRTIDLADLSEDPLPSVLVFGLVGLSQLGYEPIGARWFRLADDGAIHYLSEADIAQAQADISARTRHPARRLAAFHQLFANVELRFRSVGDPSAAVQTWRHIQANLGDAGLASAPGLLAHLASKGQIAAITKAASYLLWRKDFSRIRDYLLANMVWMVSDSSGIAPFHAQPRGFEQLTWGRFEAIAFTGTKRGERAMVHLWKQNPRRKLGFYFGYPSKANRAHLMVTRPKSPPTPR